MRLVCLQLRLFWQDRELCSKKSPLRLLHVSDASKGDSLPRSLQPSFLREATDARCGGTPCSWHERDKDTTGEETGAVLMELVGEQRLQWLVLGAYGRKGEKVLGNTADMQLKSCLTNYVLVRPGRELSRKKLHFLVATDDSPASWAAFNKVLALCGCNDRVTAVYASSVLSFTTKMQRYAETIAQRKGVEGDARLLRFSADKSVAEAVVDFVDSDDCAEVDFIVLGMKGYGSVDASGMALGSVVSDIIKRSKDSIIVIKQMSDHR